MKKKKNARKPSNTKSREQKKMFNKILFIIIYFNITILRYLFYGRFALLNFLFLEHQEKRKRFLSQCYQNVICLLFHSISFVSIIQVHPCGRYRHNTVVFILAKEYNLKNLRTIHRLDRLTSGLLLFGRSPKKARQMEHQIRNRQVQKQYICRVEGEFPE